jgi:benzoylformate decarboxylase
MAKSLGLEAIKISDPAELKPKLSDAFKRPGAKLIEVILSNSVN